jgi:hypothetical protein
VKVEDADFGTLPDWLVDRIAGLDACDRYIVLVVDPETAETDAHGPFDGIDVLETADLFRRDFDRAGLTDVQVLVARLHGPRPAQPLNQAA